MKNSGFLIDRRIRAVIASPTMNFMNRTITARFLVFIALCISASAGARPVAMRTAPEPAAEAQKVRVNVRRILTESTQGNKGFAKAKAEILKIGQLAESGLIARLAAKKSEERANAVTFLGLLKSKKSIPYLLAKSRDSHVDVRMAALEALWCFEDPELIQPMAKSYLHDKHPSVRDMAVIVLGRYRHEKAIPFLVSALGDDDRFARECARKGLALFSGKREPASDLEENKNRFWKDWYKNWLIEKERKKS